MDSLLTSAVQPARAHALPFRVIFQELLQRREANVLEQAALFLLGYGEDEAKTLTATPQEDARKALTAKIQLQEAAYEALEEANRMIRSGQRMTPLDNELKVCGEADKLLKKMLHGLKLSALSLSGGGIRSASFSLGVMEGLSRYSRHAEGKQQGLMDGLDYLSTVSGGGYIGSWLMSWVYRRFRLGVQKKHPGGMEKMSAAELQEAWQCGYREVVSAMAGQQTISRQDGIPKPLAVTGGDPEPEPTRHLRAYTSFLAPALGATLDTATLGAIFLRNLLVNWVMLLPLLLAMVCGARTVGRALLWWQSQTPATGGGQRLGDSAPQWWQWLTGGGSRTTFWEALGVFLCFLLAALIAAFALPSHDGQRSKRKQILAQDDPAAQPKKAGGWEWRTWAAPVFVALVLLGAGLLAVSQQGVCDVTLRQFWIETATGFVGFGIVGYSIARAESRRLDATEEAHRCKMNHEAGTHRRLSTSWRKFLVRLAAMSAAAFAALCASGLLLALRCRVYGFLLTGGRMGPFHMQEAAKQLFVLVAIPSICAILLITTSLLCALLGVFERDEDREWWVRSGGAVLGLNLCWIVGQALVFYGASVTHWAVATVSGLVLAGMSSLGGFSGATAAAESAPKVSSLGKAGKFLSRHKLLLPTIGLVGVLMIAVGVVTLEEWLRAHAFGYLRASHHPIVPGWAQAFGKACAHFVRCHPDGGCALLLFAVTGLLTVLFNLAININLFSLQGIYRMRLMRAYLGASNVFRSPDPFTGFDPSDTPRMFQMPCQPGVPMHLVNCTLNLTGTTNNAWRQRKAETFGFGPVACGSWRVGYVRTEDYASRHNGPDLAAAMSISGSAFNPNMGYHTSPLLSLIMTFFDVRLGAWLPNPKWPAMRNWTDAARKEQAELARQLPELLARQRTESDALAATLRMQDQASEPQETKEWKKLAEKQHKEQDKLKKQLSEAEGRIERFIGRPGPMFALSPLMQELRGTADDTRAWVELTDGGHFENLALYEMVMRRCKTIVIVDAGADPDYQFEDLGNAIRKIQIDLGVPIEFPGAMPMVKGMEAANLYCAVGTIRYGCVDQEPDCPGTEYDGTLIYLKPVLTGAEPADIFQYARTHDTFPHESTLNQFFNESQFESYRHLGSFAVETIVGLNRPKATRSPDYGTLERFLKITAALRPGSAPHTPKLSRLRKPRPSQHV